MQISIVAIVDIVLLISLLFASIKGWHIGLAMRLAHLVALVISCVIANLCAASLKAYVGKSVIVPFLQERTGNAVSAVPYAQNGLELAAQGIAYYILYAIAFAILMVILGRLIRLLHIVDHIPVIGKINKAGGAIVGFLITFIILYVVGNAFFALIPQTILDGWGFTKEAMEKTYLLQIFADF